MLLYKKKVKCHVEMSYFEVYNEKIHDLLVARDEPNQRRMPVSVLSGSIVVFSASIQCVLFLIGTFLEVVL